MQPIHRRFRQRDFSARNRRIGRSDGKNCGRFRDPIPSVELEQRKSGPRRTRADGSRVVQETHAKVSGRVAERDRGGRHASGLLIEEKKKKNEKESSNSSRRKNINISNSDSNKSRTCKGVRLEDGTPVFAKAVVITTGTFLRGVLHLGGGEKVFNAGRISSNVTERADNLASTASSSLADSLYGLNLRMGRLLNRDAARLRKSSIDFSRCDEQKGDDVPEPFSYYNLSSSSTKAPWMPSQEQVSCHSTSTNAETEKVIVSHPNYHG